MSVSTKHLLRQGPVLKTLASVAWSALRHRGGSDPHSVAPITTPTPEVVATIPPLPQDLLRDYIRHVGGDPSAYRGQVPPHLFPQWAFPLSSQVLRGVPYPLFKTLNGGCKLQINAPLPAGEPLIVRARLENIDDNGRRAVLHQRVVTGTQETPDALVCDLYAIVPLAPPQSSEGTNGHKRVRRPAKRVPHDATEIGRWKLRPDAGLDFAKLTGDFNPVHWVRPYARAFGFRNTILHGFSTMARALEGVQRTIFAGSTQAVASFDVQLTKPLPLPAKVGLYVVERGETMQVFVGDAPSGPAYLVGTLTPKNRGTAS